MARGEEEKKGAGEEGGGEIAAPFEGVGDGELVGLVEGGGGCVVEGYVWEERWGEGRERGECPGRGGGHCGLNWGYVLAGGEVFPLSYNWCCVTWEWMQNGRCYMIVIYDPSHPMVRSACDRFRLLPIS